MTTKGAVARLRSPLAVERNLEYRRSFPASGLRFLDRDLRSVLGRVHRRCDALKIPIVLGPNLYDVDGVSCPEAHGMAFSIRHFELWDRLSDHEWEFLSFVVLAVAKDMRLPLWWGGRGRYYLFDWVERAERAQSDALRLTDVECLLETAGVL